VLCNPFLGNGSRKHVPAAMNTHAIIEILLETVFSMSLVPRSYLEDNLGDQVSCSVDNWQSVLYWNLGGKT
jgi:hypothetical protein